MAGKTTITFGGNGNPPTLVATSKRRWFELYPTEIKYFSKVDETGEHGQAGRQKGAIGIFKDTKVRVDGLTLVVSNPDRDWVLRADEMAVGNATSIRARVKQGYEVVLDWGRSILDLTEKSTNVGYVEGETEEVAKGAWEERKSASSGTEAAAAAEPEVPARSFYGFDEDGDGADEDENAAKEFEFALDGEGGMDL